MIKLSRTASCDGSAENLCEEQDGEVGSTKDRHYYDSSCLYEQPSGTVSKELVSLTRDLWMWCLERDIHIQTQHLPGIMNEVADMELRSMKDRLDWKLD